MSKKSAGKMSSKTVSTQTKRKATGSTKLSQMSNKTLLSLSADYRQFIGELKDRVRSAQIAAARSVNRDLILLYWDIGQAIVKKLGSTEWGESVVERIAADLRREFPDSRGFSSDNVWRMSQFFTEYSSQEFLEQAVPELTRIGFPFLEQSVPQSDSGKKTASSKFAKRKKAGPPAQDFHLVQKLVATVPWGHHLEILKKVKQPVARAWYLLTTSRNGWSRSVLLNQIKAQAYERSTQETKTNNFGLALPKHLAEQASEMMKSRYNLEFLDIREAVLERDLENRLIESVQEFILELGYGFCFVGRPYRLVLGSKEYFVDLLFYHRFLKALVALDLKIRGFIPEDAGKMDFYLNVLNDQERGPDDQPSIGIILCAEKEDIEVEYALKSKANPIGVAQYQLQAKLPADLKGKLPTAKQLADAVRRGLLTGK